MSFYFIYSTFLLQTLSHCELITDEGIRHIGHSAWATEQLHILELDNCPLITDASLDYLTGCQNLERIELYAYDCQLITKAAIRRLRVSKLCCHGHSQVTTEAVIGQLCSIISSKMLQYQDKLTQIFYTQYPHPQNPQWLNCHIILIYHCGLVFTIWMQIKNAKL